jgi:N-acetylneuraminic acid mutarotase
MAIRLACALLLPATAHAQVGEWAWISGGSVSYNQTGVYGTLGAPAAANVPGYRTSSTTWTDSSGNLWLFGGSGPVGGSSPGAATNTSLHFNDLWKFNPATNQWTWVSGFDNTTPGVYGTVGVPTAANVPGSREDAVGWTDTGGNLWLFGGEGYDATGARGYLNDLWEFNSSAGVWAWISGSSTIGSANCYQPGIECAQSSVYCILGQPAAANVPGGRSGPVGSVDSNGNLWLFGGLNSANGVVNS